MKFGQLIEYDMRNIFLQKNGENDFNLHASECVRCKQQLDESIWSGFHLDLISTILYQCCPSIISRWFSSNTENGHLCKEFTHP